MGEKKWNMDRDDGVWGWKSSGLSEAGNSRQEPVGAGRRAVGTAFSSLSRAALQKISPVGMLRTPGPLEG